MNIDRETLIKLVREAELPIAWISETGVITWSNLERFAALVLEHGRKPPTASPTRRVTMLTFEQVETCFPDGASSNGFGALVVSAQWLHDFARAIESEATAPLVEQIKEDEALMRDVLEAMTAEPEMREGACSVATEALRQRLEAKT